MKPYEDNIKIMQYEASLIESIEIVPGVKSFRFQRAPDFNYEAGQYVIAEISSAFFRLFSLSTSPTEKEYIQFTTRMSGSDYKSALNRMNAGDKIMIKGPYGKFTYKSEYSKIAFLSGGIGITPIRSITKYLADEKIDIDSVLIYGNRNEESIIFRKDFDEMSKNGNTGNIRTVHVLSDPGPTWTGYKGFINREIISKEAPDYLERVFYIVGPPGMVNAMKKILEEMNVKTENIILENFSGY